MRPSPVPLRKAAWSRGLTEAMRLLDRAKSRPPTEADAPPTSSFPMTPGAREALRLDRGKAMPVARGNSEQARRERE